MNKRFLKNSSFKSLTTLEIGGPITAFYQIQTEKDLLAAIKYAKQKNRLWISRILLLLILELLGKRRKRGENLSETAGKVCINILLEEDQLVQQNKNIYLAHEVLQMRPLWQKDGIYQKYLADNDWVFKFLPNWTSSGNGQWTMDNGQFKKENSQFSIPNSQLNLLEQICRWLQLRYMGKPTGLEKISENALYFHPQDHKLKILTEYQKRIKKILS